jgi:hypothetical protein
LWAEVDFVVVTDYAVLCLEVKGGDLHIRGNTWYDGKRRLTHTPMEQAGGAASALRTFLRREFGDLTPTVGWGVVFPYAHYDVLDPSVERELVYDDDDIARPMQAYADRLNDYWRRRKDNGTGVQFDATFRDRIVTTIAPHFDLVSTLRSRIRGITHELVRLTDAQRHIFDGFASEPRLVVRGGAGTGKTVLALSEAERLADANRRVLVTCYSAGLAAEFRAALRVHPSISAIGAIALATRDIVAAGLADEMPDTVAGDVTRRFLPELAERAAGDLPRKYDALVVDEAQDLLGSYWLEYFDRIVEGGLATATWRFFVDPNQDLILGGHPEAIDDLDRLATSHYRLTRNCRNTRQVGLSTAMLTGLDTSDTLQVEGLDVVEHFYRSQQQQSNLAASVLRDWFAGGLEPEDAVILSHLPLQESGVSGLGESELGVPVIESDEPALRPERGIRYATVEVFKGFEADAVLVADIDDLGPGSPRLALYVGMTRSRALLGLLLDERTRDDHRALIADFASRFRP